MIDVIVEDDFTYGLLLFDPVKRAGPAVFYGYYLSQSTNYKDLYVYMDDTYLGSWGTKSSRAGLRYLCIDTWENVLFIDSNLRKSVMKYFIESLTDKRIMSHNLIPAAPAYRQPLLDHKELLVTNLLLEISKYPSYYD